MLWPILLCSSNKFVLYNQTCVSKIDVCLKDDEQSDEMETDVEECQSECVRVCADTFV